MENLGRGLAIRDGDLVPLDRIAEDGRVVRGFEEITGVANLAQALNLRIQTPLGSDVFDTRYGFDAAEVFAATATARTARDLVQLNLVRTLGTDARVREIRQVTFLDPLEVSRHRSWPVEVTVVAADGEQYTVTLQAGG
jgi:hypothetical protein